MLWLYVRPSVSCAVILPYPYLSVHSYPPHLLCYRTVIIHRILIPTTPIHIYDIYPPIIVIWSSAPVTFAEANWHCFTAVLDQKHSRNRNRTRRRFAVRSVPRGRAVLATVARNVLLWILTGGWVDGGMRWLALAGVCIASFVRSGGRLDGTGSGWVWVRMWVWMWMWMWMWTWGAFFLAEEE